MLKLFIRVNYSVAYRVWHLTYYYGFGYTNFVFTDYTCGIVWDKCIGCNLYIYKNLMIYLVYAGILKDAFHLCLNVRRRCYGKFKLWTFILQNINAGHISNRNIDIRRRYFLCLFYGGMYKMRP